MHTLLKYLPRPALIVLCVCSALFFLLAADVRYGGLVSKLDRPISEALHASGTQHSLLLQVGTDLGAGVMPKFTWALVLVLVVLKRWHYLPMLWLAVGLGSILNGKMQAFFARPRPRFEDMEILTHPGFPSGHVAGAGLFFGFLIVLAWRELRSRELKCFCIALGAAVIVFVGWTRVALLVHHATDVIGSFLWCAAWLIGCHYGNIAAYRWSAGNLEAWAGEHAKASSPLAQQT